MKTKKPAPHWPLVMLVHDEWSLMSQCHRVLTKIMYHIKSPFIHNSSPLHCTHTRKSTPFCTKVDEEHVTTLGKVQWNTSGRSSCQQYTLLWWCIIFHELLYISYILCSCIFHVPVYFFNKKKSWCLYAKKQKINKMFLYMNFIEIEWSEW